MIAILTDEIYNGVGGVLPSVDRLAVLDAERSRLFQERKALHLHDHAEIARLRAEYGAIVREHRAVRHAVAA